MRAGYDELQAGYSVPRLVMEMLGRMDGTEIVEWAKAFACGVSILDTDWFAQEFAADDRSALSVRAALGEAEPPGLVARAQLADFIRRKAESRLGRPV